MCFAASPDDSYAELAALWMLTKPAAWRHCSEAEKLAAKFFSAPLGMPGEKLATMLLLSGNDSAYYAQVHLMRSRDSRTLPLFSRALPISYLL